MGIKSYKATRDNTITNAYKLNLSTRGTGSNMGASDILEVFSIYGQQTTSSAELSRVLIQFPTDIVTSDRTAGTIPSSGSVDFYLRMFNARHSEQLPKNFVVNVLAVSSSWEEGHGLDMEGYTDETKDGIEGSNWNNANNSFTSATATISILIPDGGSASDLDNNLAGTNGMTITDSAGNAIEYIFDNTGTKGASGASHSDGIVVQIQNFSDTSDVAAQLETAINSAAGHGTSGKDTITVSRADNVITLTHDATGIAGNIAITKGSLPDPNWISISGFSGGDGTWAAIGGDYHTESYIYGSTMPSHTFTFNEGYEDIFVTVEEWLAGTQTNNGFGVHLSSSFEAYITASDDNILVNLEGSQKSFYTKRFFSRSSEFFFKRPALEARWDSRIMDDRGNFYYSSSLAPAVDNLNTIYLYNYVRGELKNIPNVDEGLIRVSIYSGSSNNSSPSGSKLQPSVGGGVSNLAVFSDKLNVTGGYVSTGIYSASFAFTGSTSLKTMFDVWHTSSNAGVLTEYFTGSIKTKTFNSPGWNQYPQYTTKITNLKPDYAKDEKARFRVFARPRNFSHTIYNVASKDIQHAILPSASFEVYRVIDNETVINNSTGSATRHTYLSYDTSGSYFDLDMSLLEPNYMYGIKFIYHSSNGWREQEETFNFRVENR